MGPGFKAQQQTLPRTLQQQPMLLLNKLYLCVCFCLLACLLCMCVTEIREQLWEADFSIYRLGPKGLTCITQLGYKCI